MSGSSLEVRRLAHELGVEVEQLSFLASAPPDAVRDVRTLLAEAVLERHEARFRRLAKLSAVAPLPVAAKIAQVALGPLLAARVAAVMDPAVAVRLASRLETGFLTELSTHLDAVRAEPILRGLPDAVVVEVGRRLLDRGEFLALGRFVSVVTTDASLDVVAEATGAQLLEVATCTEDDGALDAVVRRLTDARLRSVLEAADPAETDALVARASDDSAARLGSLREALQAESTSDS